MGKLTKFMRKKPKEPSPLEERIIGMIQSFLVPIAERVELGKEYNIEFKSFRCRRCGKIISGFSIGDHMKEEGHYEFDPVVHVLKFKVETQK